MARMAYAPEFGKVVDRNPSIFFRFKESCGRIFSDCKGMKVEEVWGSYNTQSAWKVGVQGRSYFVKQAKTSEPARKLGQTGYEQFMALKAISKFSTSHVKPIEPLFGYTGDKYSYLVLPYVGLQKVCYTDMPSKLVIEFMEFAENAEKIGIFDLINNVFHDPVRGMALVFDPAVRQGSAMYRMLGLDRL